MKKLSCFRCNTPMFFMMQEKIQLGQTGWILGDLPNLVAGSLEIEIYCCPECGKIEFFCPDAISSKPNANDGIPQKKCPKCGKTHDFDYPQCPYCGFDYYAK